MIPPGQDARMREFISFWDKLISATNPFPRENEKLPLLGQHPCNKPVTDF